MDQYGYVIGGPGSDVFGGAGEISSSLASSVLLDVLGR